MNIINLTNHEINIYNQRKDLVMSVSASGLEARIITKYHLINIVDRIPLFKLIVTEEPIGLPDEKEDTIFIVSGIFRAFYDRKDLYQPGEIIRNNNGQPIGCIGLSR